ncbi:MAG TPA: hypothetical protein HPP77_08355 [Candidatus Hydrogenedentes bacterium]|nr:hypothetical protein [Candidatus Hydrogenedentota bacterium]HIJ73102.1 hypothetical protein [Candidatus Hydrogenedentota bacterium]
MARLLTVLLAIVVVASIAGCGLRPGDVPGQPKKAADEREVTTGESNDTFTYVASCVNFAGPQRIIGVGKVYNRELGSRPFLWSYDIQSGAFDELVTSWCENPYTVGRGFGGLFIRAADEANVHAFVITDDSSRPGAIATESYEVMPGPPPATDDFGRRRYLDDTLGYYHFYRIPLAGGPLEQYTPVEESAARQLRQEYPRVSAVCTLGENDEYALCYCWGPKDTRVHYVLYDVAAERVSAQIALPASETGYVGPYKIVLRFGKNREFLAVWEWKMTRPEIPTEVLMHLFDKELQDTAASLPDIVITEELQRCFLRVLQVFECIRSV